MKKKMTTYHAEFINLSSKQLKITSSKNKNKN